VASDGERLSNVYRESYSLGGLTPDSAYEARVTAKNDYGWSEQSAPFTFYTQGKGTSTSNAARFDLAHTFAQLPLSVRGFSALPLLDLRCA